MARTSAVTVELGTIVEIHLTPRLNPGHDPGTNWRICLPEPIAIGGRLHASNRFLATFYHGVYPGSGLPNRCDRPVRQSPMVQDQKNVKQRRSLVEYDRTARVPTVPHGRDRVWEDPTGFGRNAGRLDPSKLSDLPAHWDRPPTMLFRPLDIPGLFLIELERMEDERGFFSRLFCADTFREHGLCTDYPQWSVSFNKRSGTLRGLHFQAPPQEEIKLVSCTRGAVFDVAVDLRSGSPSRGKWAAVELSADNRSMLYIPAGFAHGFQTLTDDAEVRYHISERYRPEAARGVRWDDPDLAIAWPKSEERVISSRDQTLPRLRDL